MRGRRVKNTVFLFLGPLLMRRLKERKQASRTLGEHLALVDEVKVARLGIRPLQIPSELEALLNKMVLLKPKRLLEIGTARGGTLYLFAQVAEPDACLISIDLPRGDYGRGYPKWKLDMFQSFAREGQAIHFIGANSHESETIARVEKILEGHAPDFLLIDGDHRYEGVKQDFEMYAPLVRKGGMIVFHDIVPGSEERVGGAPRFWQEIKERYRYEEIVASWEQNGYGIGILWKGE